MTAATARGAGLAPTAGIRLAAAVALLLALSLCISPSRSSAQDGASAPGPEASGPEASGPEAAAGTEAVSGTEDASAEPRGPAYGITTLEVGSVMALGLGIYIYKGERNAYDWPLAWSRIEERFTTLNQFRFDDNEFAMNNVAHPVAGALYYRFARSNGFGPLGASLYSLGGSTFWEVVVELREIASLNDLIATPAAGIALGEALHQHTEFYRRGAPGLRNSLLEKAFAGPILINRLFGERAPAPAESLTPAGLPADRPHRVEVHGGSQVRLDSRRSGDPAQRKHGWMARLGASSELGMVEPRDAGGFRETGGLPLTRLELSASFTQGVPTELHLGAETVFAGWGRARLVEEGGTGRVRGHRWLMSPATAFTMRLDDTRKTRWIDLMANAHVAGIRADGVLRDGSMRLRWNGAAYADFSSVRPLALYAFWGAGEPLPIPHSVLVRNQYYYGYGSTLRSRLELDMGPVGIRGEVDHHAFESFQSPHRSHPRQGASEVPVEDTRTYARVWLELRPAPGAVLSVGVDEARGWGRMGGHVVRDRDTRLSVRLVAAPF